MFSPNVCRKADSTQTGATVGIAPTEVRSALPSRARLGRVQDRGSDQESGRRRCATRKCRTSSSDNSGSMGASALPHGRGSARPFHTRCQSAVAPFHLPSPTHGRMRTAAVAAVRPLIERALSFPALNAIYRAATARDASQDFCGRALNELGIRVEMSERDLTRVPKSGPLIVVANHPFGGLDGLLLAALLCRVRPDARLLANYLLRCIPEMHDVCFFVDPFGGPEAARRNVAALKSAIAWVRGGGLLGIFPAGEVSHLSLRRRAVSDPDWSNTVSRLILRTQAPVLPVCIDGRNSGLFQVAGLIHPRLRTAMLPRELLAKRGQRLRVEIGSVIPFARLTKLRAPAAAPSHAKDADADRITEYLRVRTYLLKGRATMSAHDAEQNTVPSARMRSWPPVADATPADLVARDINALPEAQRLIQSGPFCVHVGGAAQLPHVLREIGRLRESTFRLVGEGTGKSLDLDRFDPHYLHLFVWNAVERHIVGAYRLGPTDDILRRFGLRGLYTSTLFRFKPRLMSRIDPALELGRSFIVPEYQRDYAPLLLLWKGIGRFVVRNSRYRRLFGAVSISDQFQSTTRQLLMAFLRQHNLDAELAAMVRPRNPPPAGRLRDTDPRTLSTLVRDVADVDELVSEIEADGRGMPVLLRQYLKLNARLLGFNIDPDFGGVLDGLALVDLLAVDRPILDRYLGREGAASFRAWHNEQDPAAS